IAPLSRRSSPLLLVGGVELKTFRDLALPAVAVREQALLIVIELLARLGRILEVRALDDGINRAGLLAEAAVDAHHHIDVVAGCAPRAVVATWSRFDGDRLCRANRLTQLAGDAALLSVRIAAQRVLATKAGRQWALLEGVVQRPFWREEAAHRQEECEDKFFEEERTDCLPGQCHFADHISIKRILHGLCAPPTKLSIFFPSHPQN